MTKNFPNWMKNINQYIQETQQTSNGINTKRSTFRSSIVKMFKDKEKNLERTKKKKNSSVAMNPHYD